MTNPSSLAGTSPPPQLTIDDVRRPVGRLWLILMAVCSFAALGVTVWLTALAARWVSVSPGHRDWLFSLRGVWSVWLGMPVAVPAAVLYLAQLIAVPVVALAASPRVRRRAWSLIATSAVTTGGATVWFLCLQRFEPTAGGCQPCLFLHVIALLNFHVVAMNLPVSRAPSAVLPVKSLMRSILLALLLLAFLIAGQLWQFNKFNVQRAAAEAQQPVAVQPQDDNTTPPNPVVEPMSPCANNNFLASNEADPDVHIAPSGLHYRILHPAQRAGARPTPGDTVRVNLHGRLVDGTTLVDTSKDGHPADLKVGEQFEGLRDALTRMSIGEKWNVVMPSYLAVDVIVRSRGTIPPHAIVIYDIELMDILAPSSPAVEHRP